MKQDGGSNHLRGYSKILHHTVKSREEKPKKITNQKKRLVFPRNQTIFRAWQSSRTYIYIGTLPHLRRSSLQQLAIVESCKRLHLMSLQQMGSICMLLHRVVIVFGIQIPGISSYFPGVILIFPAVLF